MKTIIPYFISFMSSMMGFTSEGSVTCISRNLGVFGFR